MNIEANLSANKEHVALWTRDFILVFLVNMIIFLSFQMLLPTLPVYAVKLGGNETSMGLIIGVFTVSAVLIRPFAGRMLDTGGRKVPMLFGLFVFILSVLAYNWAWSVAVLLALRLVHGFGWGIITTASGTVAADVIPPKRLGEGMGYYGLASTMSMAVAPAVGIYIINHYGFSPLFTASAALATMSLMLALVIKYRSADKNIKKTGALFEPKAFRPSLTMFFITTTYGSVVSFIAIYAAEKGILNVGIFFTVFALVLAVTRPLSGMLADRKGFDIVVIPGIIMVVLAMLTLSRASDLWIFLLAGGLYGLGFGSVQPSMQALAVKDVPPMRRGAANGTLFSAFDLGIGTGAVLWGAVSQSFGYANMYLLAGIPGLIALASYLWLKKPQNTPREVSSQ